jgi:GTP-binding protein EngB required for normal cell division
VLLVDARRGPQHEEFTILRSIHDPTWRIGPSPHVLVVATKCDKLKRSERASALARFEAIGVATSLCSSVTGEGIDQLRNKILRLAAGDGEKENATA